MTSARIGALCATLVLAAAPALAQTPNWRATPVYGTVHLDGGFAPDPTVREVRAGGTSASGVNDCPGYLNASAPDLDVHYSGSGSFSLTFSAASASDVGVLVHTPDGRWFCDDDGADAALNAKLTVDGTTSGTYSVWVLTYANSDDRPVAYVGVSELGREANENQGATSQNAANNNAANNNAANNNAASNAAVNNAARGVTAGSNTRVVDGGGSGDGMPNWMADPLYGEIALRAGFTPDPYVRNVTAGGSARNPVSGDGCTGYINLSAPDFELNYTAGSGTLPLHFYVKSSEDTSLLVYTADGRWVCDDDSGDGLNPHIQINNPGTGSYQIWVGTYASANQLRDARLHLSELSPRW